MQSESTLHQMKEAAKDTAKAGVDKLQFGWTETKEQLLPSDKPNLQPEEIPTNLRYDPYYKKNGKL